MKKDMRYGKNPHVYNGTLLHFYDGTLEYHYSPGQLEDPKFNPSNRATLVLIYS